MLAATALAATALVGTLGYTLLHAHASERRQVERSFNDRVAFVARSTGALMTAAGASSAPIGAQLLSGGPAQVAAGLRTYADQNPGVAQRVVLDANGRLVAADPRLTRATRGVLTLPQTHLRPADGPRITRVFIGPQKTPMIGIAVPFQTHFGPRVFIDSDSLVTYASFLNGYLSAGPAVPGARAYLLDDRNTVISAAGRTNVNVGGKLGWPQLLATLAAHPSGVVGDQRYASALVSGSAWRVVFVAPSKALYAGTATGMTTSWILFGGFIVAMALAVVLGVLSVRRADEALRARTRARSAEQLAHERLHDELTGLPNRNLLIDRVEYALRAQAREPGLLAVLFLDIDRFKRINDSLGHDLGDGLLRTVAERLRAVVRPTDTVSRFGGDEFLVLCPHVASARQALIVASRLEEEIERPIALDGRSVHMTASIGVAVCSHTDQTTPQALIRDADAAMYRVKRTSPGSAHLFDVEMHREALERLDREVALRAAIDNDELVIHYQPIVGLADGGIRGVEALVRWDRPGRHGLVPPLEFVSLAEESGLIVAIGDWVLRRACRDVACWRESGLIDDDFLLSVNVSPRQLADPGLTESFRAALDETDAPPRLCVEITESAVMADPDQACEALRSLRTLGVTLAIDDFGTGQTSLEQIARLPIEELKVDRSFVQNSYRERDRAIVATIATLASALGISAVVEGVETSEQAREMERLGYPLAQGFFFAHPAPAGDLAELLRKTQALEPITVG